MSFDPAPSVVRICSKGIIGKDAQADVCGVVYGHEKWETNYFYHSNKETKADQMHGILVMAQRQENIFIIGLFCTRRQFTSCLVLNHAKYFEVYLYVF